MRARVTFEAEEAGAEAIICIATAGDSDRVAQILRASYPALMAGAYDPGILAAALPAMLRPQASLLESGRYFIASSRDGTPAGCGGWSHERPGTGGIEPGLGHIRHFAVDPRHGRKGLGRSIFEACVAQASAHGVRRFECWSSLNGEGFYRALGFRSVRPIAIPMGGGVELPSILMMMDI